MKLTKTLKINNLYEQTGYITIAANILKNGGTVVFPTETVYGLGANALDDRAVNNIFIAKGRPSDNPLIVHIYDIKQVNELVSEVPEHFNKLTERFWPGPLTLVMKKSYKVPDLVTAGLDTVGIRMPSHPVALDLLREAGVPVAAPSANISGSPSPTRASHVISDMDGKVDVIIDGGDCTVGLESTVLDITGEVPVILRPGGVTLEQIEEVLGKVHIDRHVYLRIETEELKPKSPGVKYRHYSPKAQVIIVDGQLDNVVREVIRQVNIYVQQNKKVAILSTEQTKDRYHQGIVVSAGDREKPETIAFSFFTLLRHFDDQGVEVVVVEGVDRYGIGMAIMNRMIRAAEYHIINV